MPHRHRSLTAWLGIVAIWLTVVAPLVSQWRLAHTAAPDTIACSAGQNVHPPHHNGGAMHGMHSDACGYCGFFAHTPGLGSPHVAPDVCAYEADFSYVAPPEIAVSIERYPRARPRAPPENA